MHEDLISIPPYHKRMKGRKRTSRFIVWRNEGNEAALLGVVIGPAGCNTFEAHIGDELIGIFPTQKEAEAIVRQHCDSQSGTAPPAE